MLVGDLYFYDYFDAVGIMIYVIVGMRMPILRVCIASWMRSNPQCLTNNPNFKLNSTIYGSSKLHELCNHNSQHRLQAPFN